MLLQLWLECMRGLSGSRLAHCRLGRLVRLTHRLAPRGLGLIRGFNETEVSLSEIDRVVYRARAAELYGKAQTFEAQSIILHTSAP